MIGVLQARTTARRALERVANKELTSLRAALDQSEVGVVLLDSEMRAQFINRAFRRLWRLPDEVAERKPAFVGLMYHGREHQDLRGAAEARSMLSSPSGPR